MALETVTGITDLMFSPQEIYTKLKKNVSLLTFYEIGPSLGIAYELNGNFPEFYDSDTGEEVTQERFFDHVELVMRMIGTENYSP